MKKLFTLAAAVLASFSMWAVETIPMIKADGSIDANFRATLSKQSDSQKSFTEDDETTTELSVSYKFGSSNSSGSAAGVATPSNKIIAYEPKTTSTTFKVYLAVDGNDSRQLIVQEWVEGADFSTAPDTTQFKLGAKNSNVIKTYTSENTKNRTVYFSLNNTGPAFYQIIAEENGDPLPMGGQAGYSITYNKGRHGMLKSAEYTIENIEYKLKNDLKNNANTEIVLNTKSSADTYVKIPVASKVFMTVTASTTTAYSVSKTKAYDAENSVTDNVKKFTLTEGDWYIVANTSDVKITDIAFEAYAASTDATLKSISVGGSALDLSKFEEKDGALQYDYELTMGTTEVPEVAYVLNDAGASAVKTDAADVNGTTTIVVTAEDGTTTKTYKINFSVKSELGHDATLSSLKINGDEVLEADKFAYELEIGVYEALPTITYTLNDPNASAELTAATEETKVATIVVTAEDSETQKTYTVTITRAAATELVAISESTTWDWTKAGSKEILFTDATTPTKSEEFNFADVLPSPDAAFKADAIAGIMQYAVRDTKYCQGSQLRFKTTVPGTLVVNYSNTGKNRPYRHVEVNGTLSAAGEASGSAKDTEAFNVSAGEVVIKFYIPDAESPQAGNNDVVGYTMCRIYKVTFTKTDIPAAIGNTDAAVKAVKVIRDGQLIIEKNGQLFNALGQAIR